MKKEYLDLKAEIVFFEEQDVITGSLFGPEDKDVTGDDLYGDF